MGTDGKPGATVYAASPCCRDLCSKLTLRSSASSQAKRHAPPDLDYPTYGQVPDEVTFSCHGKEPGFYADVDYECQVGMSVGRG